MSVSREQTLHWANRYLSMVKIGKGSFGTVYKVKDSMIHEGHGSIKVLKEIPVANMDQDEIDDCAREGKLLSKLSFPGIVQFFDSFCYGDMYCIITEFCEGGDLNQLIVSTKKRGARLEEKRILRWFIQLMQALDYIHKRKILHRDMKARNIFLKNDSIKIGDFGISRILNCTMDMASTFVGTPFYMSPEVLKHDGYNAVSDVWSAGVILYEMCALKHAFDAQGIMAVMYKIVEGPCPCIPDYYSKELQNVVQRILVKDPVHRPTATEVLQMECIQKAIHDTFLDLNPTLDLDEVAIQSETRDIKDFVSQTNTMKTIKDLTEEETLTPKQKMDLRKKNKADQEAEEKKQMGLKIYQDTRESNILTKQKSTVDSLPFSKRRIQNSVTLNSSYDEQYQRLKEGYDSTRASGSKTVIRPQSDILYQRQVSETLPNRRLCPLEDTAANPTVIPISHLNKTFTVPSQNQINMYHINNLKSDDFSPHNVITYNNASDPGPTLEENTINDCIFYDDDFSDNDSSENDLPDRDQELTNESVLTKFQDDEENDPYGTKTKNKKIENMKRKCLEIISSATLDKALAYLEQNTMPDYISRLKTICESDNAALLVDQLYFLMTNKTKIY